VCTVVCVVCLNNNKTASSSHNEDVYDQHHCSGYVSDGLSLASGIQVSEQLSCYPVISSYSAGCPVSSSYDHHSNLTYLQQVRYSQFLLPLLFFIAIFSLNFRK